MVLLRKDSQHIGKSIVQEYAQRLNMSCDQFIGEMRKLGCSEPTALKIWRGEYETFEDFNDNNVQLSNLRKAAVVLRVGTGSLLPDQADYFYFLFIHSNHSKGNQP